MRTLLLLMLCLSPAGGFAQEPDLNVLLMQTTFLIRGPSKAPGNSTLGTAFLLLRPFSKQPDTKTVSGKPVLVTAAHVLDEMVGDNAEIFLRAPVGAEQWRMQIARVPIREGGRARWKKAQDSDIAVMYVSWPVPLPGVVPTSFLADDELLRKEHVGPGVELNVLGYPLGNPGNAAFFPILRTGVVASYPLTPTADTETFLMDFRIFKGNSGGPVYYSRPIPPGSAVMCCPPQFVMGLVSQEAFVDMPYSQLQLSLGQIVHASLIKAAIDLLPQPEAPEADGQSVAITLAPDSVR